MGPPMTRAADPALREGSPRYVLRGARLLFIVVSMWLAWTSPAWANQPPGPQMLLSEILILPLMMLLTALGGGYAVMRAANIKRRRWLIAVVVVAILLTGINEGLSAMLMLVLGPYVIVRGVRLALWGARARRPPDQHPAYLANASGGRLLTAGLLTCLTAVALVGLNFAFVGWWPGEYYLEQRIKQVVALELVNANKQQAGDAVYQLPELRMAGTVYDQEFKLGPGGKSFQARVWPKRMPFFPYNYLVTLPSFYADQTGQLRMIRVHKPGQRCPPNAPVYYRVHPEDAQAQQ